MQITSLALGALGLASLTRAQNGNDRLILNNRTGLAPVVYDGFTTLYTNSQEPLQQGISGASTASLFRSNTFIKPTTSVQCWCNGDPCGQNGAQHHQRRVANFARATAGVARRVPPPEFFSSHTDVQLPDHTVIPENTGDGLFNILPLTTSLLSAEPTDARTQPCESEDCHVDILPIPTSLLGDKQYDVSLEPSETDEAIFSISPISSTTSSEHTAIPTEWWRCPSIAEPVQGHSSAITIDCNKHYCPSGVPTVIPLPSTPTLSVTDVLSTLTPTTSSHFAIPPEATDINTPILGTPILGTPRRKGPHIEIPDEAGVPIEWWRGPSQVISPNAHGPHHNQPVETSVSTFSPSPPSTSSSGNTTVPSTSLDPCFRHYCPSKTPVTAEPMFTLTTMETVTVTVTESWGTREPPATSSQFDSPPELVGGEASIVDGAVVRFE